MPPPKRQSNWKLVGGKFTRTGPPAKSPTAFNAVGPPARRTTLPSGTHVKVVEEAFDAGTFMLVTNGVFPGFVLGPRLDRGRGIYPAVATKGLSLDESKISMKVWDAFVELQQQKKK